MAKRTPTTHDEQAGRGKRPAPPTTQVDLVPAFDREEVELTTRAGMAVKEFLAGVPAFFAKARTLELNAKMALDKAKATKPPKTAEEDEAIQRLIKANALDTKEIKEHWTITAILDGMHKRAVAVRKRGTDAREEAGKVWTELHNGYTAAARRAAEIEQDRLRVEAERQAQADRDRELAALEAQAVAAEEASADLSEREEAFADLVFRRLGPGYELDLDLAIVAAKAAGYKDPQVSGRKLLASEKIAAAIKAKYESAALREQLAAVRETPLDVQVATVKADISYAPGAHDRTTYSYELLDEEALIAACIEGKFGIPRDILTVKQPKLNQYAKDMKKLINRWPGGRLKKTTGVV